MGNQSDRNKAVEALIAEGVDIPCPEAVEIDASVAPKRIAAGVVIHAGSCIRGADTSIGPGCRIGQEAPATVENCQLGKDVELKGGYFSGSVFLDRAQMGSGAHVRDATILEEEACAAHTVGLKQTILLPFVTLGSLINFCDVLMAGGASRKSHSEVGSSYIHFNYTPHQDKATASLVGDVPRGIMLDQPPIFLGGQGGLVGPARVAYGCVIAAGSVQRGDALDENMLLGSLPAQKMSAGYAQGAYRNISRILTNNFIYIGNIRALQMWYRVVRKPLMVALYDKACCEGALRCLDEVLTERIGRLGQLAGKMAESLKIGRAENDPALAACLDEQERFMKKWPELGDVLQAGAPDSTGGVDRDDFLSEWEKLKGGSYLEAVRGLGSAAKQHGVNWLQAIVDSVAEVRSKI